ncbi:LEM3 (ligand-effect modulator 3) family / CDC50 family protein [Cardiosporidium cionae]|uniref:LEM3 (Ligand-effect modulator 3) family / CDC50 family protein n=1 Tax=Cardiosporidium cionae TaxID=476202 RepID=A0ABQ7J6V8_9APIC|nr:LEM3 (ligand-effect modulator 3) family / CDC50 family protein [Cardiosporidium cionae]|eukprot:KAF8819430.1 LEM3 (ligand-effect modulator 3) family / CDC50 family protein [Cardiosporidium cionae]
MIVFKGLKKRPKQSHEHKSNSIELSKAASPQIDSERSEHKHKSEEPESTPLELNNEIKIEQLVSSPNTDLNKSLEQSGYDNWRDATKTGNGCQPYLSRLKIVILVWLLSISFFIIGLSLLLAIPLECSKDYTNWQIMDSPPHNSGFLTLRIDSSDCNYKSASQLKGNIFLFYELSNFYQNHRSYIFSKSAAQLRVSNESGNVYVEESKVSSCSPRILSEDQRILHPCGQSALSVFNDSYNLFRADEITGIMLDESKKTITFKYFAENFVNPTAAKMEETQDKVSFWLYDRDMEILLHSKKQGVGEGVENSHFIVWMNNAALPNFRKPYAKVAVDVVDLPVVLKFKNYFPVKPFAGTKKVVLAEVSWFSGYNTFLPIAYLSSCAVIAILAAILTYGYLKHDYSELCSFVTDGV